MYQTRGALVPLRHPLYPGEGLSHTRLTMRFLIAMLGLLSMASQLPAGPAVPVDISNAVSQWLNPQDAVLFTVCAASYEINAPAHGLAPYPAHVMFQFITAPESAPGSFEAFLASVDGSVTVDFPGSFSWLTAYTRSSGYTGGVSVPYGSMNLTATESAELFASPLVVFGLRNQGSRVEVGQPPNQLPQDLSVCFSSSGLAIGGFAFRAQYLDPPAALPEPGSGRLLLAMGLALWARARASCDGPAAARRVPIGSPCEAGARRPGIHCAATRKRGRNAPPAAFRLQSGRRV
jgi:hypothetical protein